MKKRHPIQPLEDVKGVTRFKENSIVRFLLDNGGYDMNSLCMKGFDKEDWIQFAQLIGYSLSGWGDLSYVDNDTYEVAHQMSNGLDERDARIEALEGELESIREPLKQIAEILSDILPYSED
jgi:hypothetical protein